jgi:hypothetical protein
MDGIPGSRPSRPWRPIVAVTLRQARVPPARCAATASTGIAWMTGVKYRSLYASVLTLYPATWRPKDGSLPPARLALRFTLTTLPTGASLRRQTSHTPGGRNVLAVAAEQIGGCRNSFGS